jgi:amino acid transporter
MYKMPKLYALRSNAYEKEQNMDKNNLLEKIYDKYQMEINRKDRLEGKAIGYYTIIGIFFAGFLVVEPIILGNSKLLFIPSFKELLAIINYILVLIYFVLFIYSIITLHNCYKPKTRPEFDPIANWEKLIAEDENRSNEMVKNELIKIIRIYEDKNYDTVKKLARINTVCIICALLMLAIFIILILSYYI